MILNNYCAKLIRKMNGHTSDHTKVLETRIFTAKNGNNQRMYREVASTFTI